MYDFWIYFLLRDNVHTINQNTRNAKQNKASNRRSPDTANFLDFEGINAGLLLQSSRDLFASVAGHIT